MLLSYGSFFNQLIIVLLLQEFNPDPVIPIYCARPDQVEKALRHVYQACVNKLKGKELELLLAILPDNNGSLYGKLAKVRQNFSAQISRRLS